MATNRTLLQHGCIITVDKESGNFRRADVLIEGAKIAAIGPDLEVTDAEVIDASNMIVMPGFIDSHRHLWEGRANSSLVRTIMGVGSSHFYYSTSYRFVAKRMRS